ncbi:hypothetical protein FIU92_22650 (plasmid) [Ruegeria sp. THAF33]|nr:hypothetical protein FIU92_22650 [Ruegeria sp. THAF33]
MGAVWNIVAISLLERAYLRNLTLMAVIHPAKSRILSTICATQLTDY